MLEVRFAGIEAAAPTPEVLAALESADAIVLCPSNPIVSIGPILAVPGMREAISRRGPAACRSRRSARSSAARRSRARRTGCWSPSATRRRPPGWRASTPDLVDTSCWTRWMRPRPPPIEALGLRPLITDTIMTDDKSRARLAGDVLAAVLAVRRTSVVVPVQAFDHAKSRLGAVLDPEERRDLVEHLLRRHRDRGARDARRRRGPRRVAGCGGAGASPRRPGRGPCSSGPAA